VICVGRPATRLIGGLMGANKEYLATVALGNVSTTLDPEGEISAGGPVDQIDEPGIESVLETFRGTIMQAPPQYSAVKHKGKPLYHYARKGVHVEKEPRRVTIHTLEWRRKTVRGENGTLTLELRIVCSKGTYIRSLAADIGRTLGCGAYLAALRRTRSGFFNVENAVPGSGLYERKSPELVRANMIPVENIQKILQLS
jgi:tRNA pseudouridine55 synthase